MPVICIFIMMFLLLDCIINPTDKVKKNFQIFPPIFFQGSAFALQFKEVDSYFPAQIEWSKTLRLATGNLLLLTTKNSLNEQG